jgi:hypothetical protein
MIRVSEAKTKTRWGVGKSRKEKEAGERERKKRLVRGGERRARNGERGRRRAGKKKKSLAHLIDFKPKGAHFSDIGGFYDVSSSRVPRAIHLFRVPSMHI